MFFYHIFDIFKFFFEFNPIFILIVFGNFPNLNNSMPHGDSVINLFFNICWLLTYGRFSWLTVAVQWFTSWKQLVRSACKKTFSVSKSLIILIHIIVVWFFVDQSHQPVMFSHSCDFIFVLIPCKKFNKMLATV